MSAANAVKDHLKSWIFGTQEGEYASMGVYVEKEVYGVPEDIVFSFPLKCKGFEWEIVEGLELNEFSKQKLAVTLKEL